MQFDWASKKDRLYNRVRRESQWHRWFAWKPVRIYEYQQKRGGRYAFLEMLYRKRRDRYEHRPDEYVYMTKQEYFKSKLKGQTGE